ncbi:MAG: XamI family restriction endonuclease [Acidobacteriia bacterium]|nr:XamI family restriction endonuclease [Terriglobia bacterium]
MSRISPPHWTEEELGADRTRSIELFRQERMQEPLEDYLKAFEKYQVAVENLLETSVDLLKLDDAAISILTDKNLLQAFRYLAGPFISADDLKTLSDAVLSPARIRSDARMARRVVDVIRLGLDRRRFPWVAENREPTEAERAAAVLASASLLATTHVRASRRNEGKATQEHLVEKAFLGANLTKVGARPIDTLNQSPSPGEFCGESMLGTRKADFVLGLWDNRVMAIECKVSNSAVNSVKRLNNDAAAKAESRIHDFGTKQVIPAAVLSGVYKLHNLVDAQNRGLTLFWAHDLGQLLSWVVRTR